MFWFFIMLTVSVLFIWFGWKKICLLAIVITLFASIGWFNHHMTSLLNIHL